ncbi:hypothetical protein N8343_07755 [Akkermansiaceae bacterium]|nr:hypothetical protein [bacterium]MDC1405540.1 hypothetical protein [Akkermansiaceae bacterium]
MIEGYCETCDKSVVGRFCTDCGKETVERKPVESPPSQAVGPAPQKIMAGGDLTHNVTHTNTNTTTVYNQDETKQVQICAVSGRQAEVIKGHVCPSCGLWVHGDYFDRDTNLCSTCNSQKAKGAQQTFRDKVVEFLSDDQISKDELQFLRDFGGRLNISIVEQDNTIATIRRERVQESSVPLSRIERVKFDNAIKILFDDNHEDVAGVGKEAALGNLEAIYARHPNNMDVAGYLLMAYSSGPMSGLSQSERRWAERVKELIDTSPAFAHDTEKKYFYTCMAALGLLWADRMSKEFQENFPATMPQEQQQLMEDMLLSADESRRMEQLYIEACSELEKAFPESDEWLCVEMKLLFEEYFANGSDPATKSEILQVLPESSGEISGDIGEVFVILREKLMQDESFALLEQEKREGLSAFGQVIYWSLFCSSKDVANELIGKAEQDWKAEQDFKGENQDADKEQAEEDEEYDDEEDEIILDLADAEYYLKNLDGCDLSRATSITDEAAEALSISSRTHLELSGLKDISDAAAQSLAKSKGSIDLNGLTTLSVAAAQALAEHTDQDYLFLEGLSELGFEAELALASSQKEERYLVLNDYMANRIQAIKDAPASVAPPPLPGESGVPLSTTPTGDSIEVLQQIYDQAYQALEGTEKVYTSGNIPSKKLAGAVKGYLPPDQVQNIQILYDDTVFGGAKEGLSFNGHTIYFKEIAAEGRSVSLKEVESFLNPKGKQIEIYLRAGTIVKIPFTEKEAAKALEKFFQAALVLFKRLNA